MEERTILQLKNLSLKEVPRDGDMTQWIKGLANKPEDLGSIPDTLLCPRPFSVQIDPGFTPPGLTFSLVLDTEPFVNE